MDLQGVVTGKRPDITPAQIGAAVMAGIPIISNLLAAFGVFSPSPDQQAALGNAINWGVPFAGLLIFGDAGVRYARNLKDATVEAAAIRSPDEPNDLAHATALANAIGEKLPAIPPADDPAAGPVETELDPADIPTHEPDPELLGEEVNDPELP